MSMTRTDRYARYVIHDDPDELDMEDIRREERIKQKYQESIRQFEAEMDEEDRRTSLL